MAGPRSPDTMKDFDEWVDECIEARLSAALGDLERELREKDLKL